DLGWTVTNREHPRLVRTDPVGRTAVDAVDPRWAAVEPEAVGEDGVGGSRRSSDREGRDFQGRRTRPRSRPPPRPTACPLRPPRSARTGAVPTSRRPGPPCAPAAARPAPGACRPRAGRARSAPARDPRAPPAPG